MEKKTAKGLVEWAKSFVGNPYWYGTCCYDCTEDLLKSKTKQYPSHYTEKRMARYKEDIKAGRKCADCVGLIKGYIWDENGKRKYDSKTDLSADGMYNACVKCGTIGTLPEIPGLLLWQKGHIGVYIGNGQAVEARGFAYGCRITKVSDRTWTHWGQCAYIEYEADAPEETEIPDSVPVLIAKGSRGDDVYLLQDILSACGYELGDIDGIFGSKTYAAVRQYQTDRGLEVDGIVGNETWYSLLMEKNAKIYNVTIYGLVESEALMLKNMYKNQSTMWVDD